MARFGANRFGANRFGQESQSLGVFANVYAQQIINTSLSLGTVIKSSSVALLPAMQTVDIAAELSNLSQATLSATTASVDMSAISGKLVTVINVAEATLSSITTNSLKLGTVQAGQFGAGFSITNLTSQTADIAGQANTAELVAESAVTKSSTAQFIANSINANIQSDVAKNCTILASQGNSVLVSVSVTSSVSQSQVNAVSSSLIALGIKGTLETIAASQRVASVRILDVLIKKPPIIFDLILALTLENIDEIKGK